MTLRNPYAKQPPSKRPRPEHWTSEPVAICQTMKNGSTKNVLVDESQKHLSSTACTGHDKRGNVSRENDGCCHMNHQSQSWTSVQGCHDPPAFSEQHRSQQTCIRPRPTEQWDHRHDKNVATALRSNRTGKSQLPIHDDQPKNLPKEMVASDSGFRLNAQETDRTALSTNETLASIKCNETLIAGAKHRLSDPLSDCSTEVPCGFIDPLFATVVVAITAVDFAVD